MTITSVWSDEFDAFTVQIDNMAIIAREADGKFVVLRLLALR